MCLTSNVTTPVHDARGGSVRASNGRELVLRTSGGERKGRGGRDACLILI